jgi:hypothetical protein
MSYVSAETAGKLAGRLDGWWTPRGITFMDISGSRVRLRDPDVQGI